MPSSIQKTNLQTRTIRFRELNPLKRCCERVCLFSISCFVGSLYDTLLDDSMTLLPRTSHFSQSPIVEKHIQHFIDFCPALDPGFLIHVDASLPETTIASGVSEDLYDSNSSSDAPPLHRQAVFQVSFHFSLSQKHRESLLSDPPGAARPLRVRADGLLNPLRASFQ